MISWAWASSVALEWVFSFFGCRLIFFCPCGECLYCNRCLKWSLILNWDKKATLCYQIVFIHSKKIYLIMAGLSCEELSFFFFFSFIPREKYLVLEAVGIAQTPCLLIRAWSYLVKEYSQLYKVGNLYNIMVIYYVFF